MKYNKLLLTGVGLFIAVLAYSQSLLNENWKFKVGDSSAYANVGFDDKTWQSIKAGECIEAQGMSSFSGIGWYRCTINVSSDNKIQAKKYGGFSLFLATIDDADVTYFNGKQIGSMGSFPPNRSQHGIN
jgi:hypothetical protein